MTHNGTAPPLGSPYSPTYPPSLPPGYYGPRQNYDFLNPHFRRYAERIIRQVVGHFKDHPAVIGYQIDNETFPTGVATPYTTAGVRRAPEAKVRNARNHQPHLGAGLLGPTRRPRGRTCRRGTAF